MILPHSHIWDNKKLDSELSTGPWTGLWTQ